MAADSPTLLVFPCRFNDLVALVLKESRDVVETYGRWNGGTIFRTTMEEYLGIGQSLLPHIEDPVQRRELNLLFRRRNKLTKDRTFFGVNTESVGVAYELKFDDRTMTITNVDGLYTLKNLKNLQDRVYRDDQIKQILEQCPEMDSFHVMYDKWSKDERRAYFADPTNWPHLRLYFKYLENKKFCLSCLSDYECFDFSNQSDEAFTFFLDIFNPTSSFIDSDEFLSRAYGTHYFNHLMSCPEFLTKMLQKSSNLSYMPWDQDNIDIVKHFFNTVYVNTPSIYRNFRDEAYIRVKLEKKAEKLSKQHEPR